MKKILVLLFAATLSVSALADGSKVKLGGYCSVAYLGYQKALFGSPEFSSEYEGSSYLFVSKAAKEMFDKEPAKFVKAIQYDAWCATGLALGKKLATDPKIFSVLDGKVYFFSSEKAKEAFDGDAKNMIAKANKNFANGLDKLATK